jgi:nucleotidyltransferase DUF2204
LSVASKGYLPDTVGKSEQGTNHEAYTRVLGDAATTLHRAGIPFVVMGSFAAALYGEASWPKGNTDVDLFIYEQDIDRAHAALTKERFTRDDSGPDWLSKARKDGVLVDLIFRAAGETRLDDEMLHRAARQSIGDHDVPVIPPEDYVVMQSLSHGKETPDHWFNALGVLHRTPLDWDYLIRRGQGRDRVLSILLYARADGVEIPAEAVESLQTEPSVDAHH